MKQFLIGRSSKCNIVLTDRTVSSIHASLLIQTDGSIWIQDLGSLNGTFLNNYKINTPTQLHSGDSLKLGSYSWKWEPDVMERFISSKTSDQNASHETLNPINNQSTHFKSSKTWLFSFVSLALIIGVVILGIKMGTSTIFDSTNNSPQKQAVKKIEYNTDCLSDSSNAGKLIKIGKTIETTAIDMANVNITVEEEAEVGKTVFESTSKNETILTSGINYEKVEALLSKILAKIPQPKFKYKIYVVKANTINAFTAGGNIFIYEGIINFTKSDDELISIIGHEVYHNELGHIANALKKQKAAEQFIGKGNAWIAYAAAQILTSSFNQEQEAMSDFHGVDIAIACGFDGCKTINLWERMAENENENEIAKLSRSHPFSNERKTCIKRHIQRNYNYTCN